MVLFVFATPFFLFLSFAFNIIPSFHLSSHSPLAFFIQPFLLPHLRAGRHHQARLRYLALLFKTTSSPQELVRLSQFQVRRDSFLSSTPSLCSACFGRVKQSQTLPSRRDLVAILSSHIKSTTHFLHTLDGLCRGKPVLCILSTCCLELDHQHHITLE